MDVILCPLQFDDPPSHHLSLGDISRFISASSTVTVTTGSSIDTTPATATATASTTSTTATSTSTTTTTSTTSTTTGSSISLLPVPLLRIITMYVNDDNPTRQPLSEIAATFNNWK
jgi:hypothetical protein